MIQYLQSTRHEPFQLMITDNQLFIFMIVFSRLLAYPLVQVGVTVAFNVTTDIQALNARAVSLSVISQPVR